MIHVLWSLVSPVCWETSRYLPSLCLSAQTIHWLSSKGHKPFCPTLSYALSHLRWAFADSECNNLWILIMRLCVNLRAGCPRHTSVLARAESHRALDSFVCWQKFIDLKHTGIPFPIVYFPASGCCLTTFWLFDFALLTVQFFSRCALCKGIRHMLSDACTNYDVQATRRLSMIGACTCFLIFEKTDRFYQTGYILQTVMVTSVFNGQMISDFIDLIVHWFHKIFKRGCMCTDCTTNRSEVFRWSSTVTFFPIYRVLVFLSYNSVWSVKG